MRSFLEYLRRDTLCAVLHEEARARIRVLRPAGDENVVARELRHDADMPRLDGDVVVELHLVGVWVDTVLASSEDIAQDAARPVAGDDLALREVLSELADEDAELAGRDVNGLGVAPFPRPRVTEMPALRQHRLLNALVLRPWREYRVRREVLARLLVQDGYAAVVRLDTPPIPHPQRQDDEHYCRHRKPDSLQLHCFPPFPVIISFPFNSQIMATLGRTPLHLNRQWKHYTIIAPCRTPTTYP